jgi:hypothetical protein
MQNLLGALLLPKSLGWGDEPLGKSNDLLFGVIWMVCILPLALTRSSILFISHFCLVVK